MENNYTNGHNQSPCVVGISKTTGLMSIKMDTNFTPVINY